MKQVISIKDLFGRELSLDKMDILYIGKDCVYAVYKGYGDCFAKMYRSCDGYTITIQEG